MKDRRPHYMGEPDWQRENAAHDRALDEEYEETQEAGEKAAAERFNVESDKGPYS